MSRSSILISLLLVALCPLVSFAQMQSKKKSKADTVQVKKDYRPTGVRIGTDVIALAKTQYVDTYKGWEVNADVDFDRYYLAVDVGSWSRDFDNKLGDTYSNEGNYFRIGGDVNFLLKDPEKNLLFLGLRYGHAVFSEDMTVTIEDPVWGTFTDQHFVNTDVTAHWFELTGGLKVKIWKMIWMGYTGRFKFGMKTGKTQQMLPHDIPGYGTTDEQSTWGFNYHIFFRIPIRKAAPEVTVPAK